jgi:molybdopterin synthase sulfur carrier subunit
VVTVRFFAGIREQLDCDCIELPWDASIASLAALERELIDSRGPDWKRVLEQENLIRAINQCVTQPEARVRDGDEVAFYPPVTGG